MEIELIQELNSAGFPHITRWEMEHNRRRVTSVTGILQLPCAEAILSEIDFCILLKLDDEYAATLESAWIGEGNIGYIDTGRTEFFMGKAPEVALAKLYIHIKSKKNLPN